MSAEEDRWPSLTANKDRKPPYGWLQWKGTEACMDVHCLCGAHMHVDDDFLYYIQCPYCGQRYECSGFITLHPIDFAPETIRLLDKDAEDFA